MDYKSLSTPALKDCFSDVITFEPALYHHQLASLAFSLGERLREVAFLHDIGTGKTRCALELIRCLNPKKVLIVCPPSVIEVWEEEIEKFTDLKYTIIEGSKEQRKKLCHRNTPLFLINYEGLRSIACKVQETVKGKKNVADRVTAKGYGFDMIVADECHRFRDPGALWSRIAFGFSSAANYVLGMTGTPIGRSTVDLFGIYLFLDNGKTFGPRIDTFLQKYFYKEHEWGDWIPKRLCHICKELYIDKVEHLASHNVSFEVYRRRFPFKEKSASDIILDKIKKTSTRYSKEECCDLPAEIYEVKWVTPSARQIEITKRLINGLPIDDLNRVNVTRHAQKFLQITSGFILKGKQAIDLELFHPKAEELMDVLKQTTGKVIIYHFYVHETKTIGKLLKTEGWKYAAVDGTVKDKKAQFRKFREDPNCRFLIAHPKTGGEGLNLQFCNTTIFYSNGYIGNTLRTQAEGRTLREGQMNDCLYIDLVMKGTLDEIIYNSLKARSDYIKAILEYLKKHKPDQKTALD